MHALSRIATSQQTLKLFREPPHPVGRSRARAAPGASVRSLFVVRPLVVVLALLAATLLSGCGSGGGDVSTSRPAANACRNLTAADIAAPSNHTRTVPCSNPHDAQTYAVGQLPARFAGASYDDAGVAAWTYQRCLTGLEEEVGADESTLMRSILTWVSFQPSPAAWSAGARWYRCDAVGGQSPSYVDLPTTLLNLLRGKNLSDQWMVCAKGDSVATGVRLPCSQPHDWRAVTTIKVGEPADPYPGQAQVVATTKRYCAGSVSAYLGYPASYQYGYTYFGQAEWAAGNRRSVCWAKTTQ